MSPQQLLRIEPVTNRRLELQGYALAGAPPPGELAELLGDPAGEHGVARRLRKRFLLVPLAQAEHLAGLGEQLVVAVPAPAAADGLAAVRPLRGAGARLCLDLAPAEVPAPEVRNGAGFLRVNAVAAGDALETACQRVSTLGPKLVVDGLTDARTFERAALGGAGLFQGYFFNEPGVEAGRALSPNYANIAALMQLARDNAPVAKLEQVLKRDATLSFRLLRYINSAGFGLSCEIQSFRHAIAVLGYQNLYRWLALLLVTAARQNAAPALVTTAIGRGRLAELLAEGLMAREEADNLFIVGAFSLLPAIMRTPMDKLVEQIPLGEPIVDALFHREGPYGPFLRLVELLESPGADTAGAVTELASLLGLTTRSLNQRQLEALAWAENLG